jgi:hypothetical protein
LLSSFQTRGKKRSTSARKNADFFFAAEKKMTPSDEVLVKWYEARDAFLGTNYTPQDCDKGVRLARTVAMHVPEAKWLCEMFPDHDEVVTRELATQRLRQATNTVVTNAYREHFYAGLVPNRSARCNHPVSTAYWSWEAAGNGEEDFEAVLEHQSRLGPVLRKHADIDREPRAMVVLSQFDDGHSRRDTKKLLLRACNLGYVKVRARKRPVSLLTEKKAWLKYGEMHHSDNPKRYRWMGKAAARGHRLVDFLEEVTQYAKHFSKGQSGTSECIVEIARACQDKAMFSQSAFSTRDFEYAHNDISWSHRCAQFSAHIMHDARAAVGAWTIIARRLRVVKDMRRVIGERILNEWVRDVPYTLARDHDWRSHPQMNTIIVTADMRALCEGLQ